MQFSISGVGGNQQYVEGDNVRGLLVSVYATTVADITTTILEGINVSVQLIRNGIPYQVVSGNLFALGMANNPGTFEFQSIFSNYKSCAFDWGQVINLKGNDRLTVMVNTTTAATGQLVTVSTWSGHGVGDYIPQVRVSSVDSNQSNQTHPGGDDISLVSVVSDTTNFDCTQISIVSRGSGYSQTLSTGDFTSLMSEQFDSAPVYFAFSAYNGAPLDGVTITTNNAAQSGNTFVVVYSGIYTDHTTGLATNLTQKVIATAAEKISSPSNPV